jgi:anti-anti-sigma factor
VQPPYRHITVKRQNGVCCVRLRQHQMEEPAILEMADELLNLIHEQGCRKLALSLGPLECLYSVFLAKLVMIRRHLTERRGALKLCEVSPQTLEVFEACRLKEHFDFLPDQATAVAALTGESVRPPEAS